MNPDNRTDDELNAIIANWMPGCRPESGRFDEFPEPEHWIDQEDHFFCEDLNACHEAEERLTDGQFDMFRWILWDSVKQPTINAWFRAHLSATARQRAEALVRVIEQQKGQQL